MSRLSLAHNDSEVPSRVFWLVSRGQFLLRSLLPFQHCSEPLLHYTHHLIFLPHRVSHTFPFPSSIQVKWAGVVVFCYSAPWFLICSRCAVVNLLSGRAAQWATAVIENQTLASVHFDLLKEKLRRVFNNPDQGEEAAAKLLSLRQESTSVADYSSQVCILAADSGSNDSTLWGVYMKGLGEELKDKLAARDKMPDLKTLGQTVGKVQI